MDGGARARVGSHRSGTSWECRFEVVPGCRGGPGPSHVGNPNHRSGTTGLEPPVLTVGGSSSATAERSAIAGVRQLGYGVRVEGLEVRVV